jgi:phosphoribosylanthranilate isomerase
VETLFQAADAVVLDTAAANGLGGSGELFDWEAVAGQLGAIRRRARMVLAGGLRPDNVALAIRALRPDVVDVSSGVESAPGIKDFELMRRFVDAVGSV